MFPTNGTILNDREITQLARKGMISPFTPKHVSRSRNGRKRVLSYGLSSFGYDLRLSSKEFYVFRRVPGMVVDPKNFNRKCLELVPLQKDGNGKFFIIPANSYGLGVAVERLSLPKNVTGVCLGKSTLARVGLIANVTPAESFWSGHLTLEFSNASSSDCRIYADEGCVQMLFFRGNPCKTGYQDRAGKYESQAEEVTMARP
jgi:dCTP deaminase